jgi:hypothetical protein
MPSRWLFEVSPKSSQLAGFVSFIAAQSSKLQPGKQCDLPLRPQIPLYDALELLPVGQLRKHSRAGGSETAQLPMFSLLRTKHCIRLREYVGRNWFLSGWYSRIWHC